jgi:hypothetical protein
MIKSRLVLAACCLASVASLAAGCGARPSAAMQAKAAVVARGASSGAGHAAAAGPPRCQTKALKLTVGMGEGAAGTVYTPLNFTNKSGSKCTLDGYPGVAFVTAPHGKMIGAPAGRRGTTRVAKITLSPGATAHATLGVSDVLISNNCAGHRVRVHWIQVYPPGAFTALYARFNVLGCAKKSLVTTHVSSVSAGKVA